MLSISSSSKNDVLYLLEELLAQDGPTAAEELYQRKHYLLELGELLYISLAMELLAMDQRVLLAKRMKQLACSRRNAEVLEVVVGGIELKRR
jgi:hypothetical protein